MKKYGLRIGNIGIEFVSVAERDKAIKDFTTGTDVVISDSGIKFSEGKGNFSVYDRETKEVIVTCKACTEQFGIESCGKREHPVKYPWEKTWRTEEGYICDACLASAEKAKKLFDAQQIVDANKEE